MDDEIMLDAAAVCSDSANMSTDVSHNSLRLNSVFSLNKLHNVLCTFGAEKTELVKSMCFAGLFKVRKQTQISRQLAFWLLRRFDCSTGCFVLKDGVRLRLTDVDVHFVLQLPYEDSVRVRPCVRRPGDVIRRILHVGTDMEIGIDYLEHLLVHDYGPRMSTKERNAFKIAFVLFVDAYFLAPKGSAPPKVNCALFPDIANPNLIHTKNWAAYVLRGIKDAARKVQGAVRKKNKSVNLECCLIFLEVFYLDNLDMGHMNSDFTVLPRVADFPAERLKIVINEDRDTLSDDELVHNFGKLKIRPHGDVIYSRGARVAAPTINTPAKNSKEYNKEEPHGDDVITVLQHMRKDIRKEAALFIERVESYFDKVETAIAVADAGGYPVFNLSAIKDPAPVDKDVDVQFGTPVVPYKISSTPGTRDHISLGSSVSVGAFSDTDNKIDSPEIVVYSAGPAFDKSGARCDAVEGRCFSPPLDLFSETWPTEVVAEKNVKDYPSSPFELQLPEPVEPKLAIITLVRMMPQLDIGDIKRIWFMHNTPTQIALSGQVLQGDFTGRTDFCVNVMEALFRLNSELDGLMYRATDVKRWRHFLPVSWAEIVLHKPAIDLCQLTKGMFTATHITYDASACRMIIAPVMVENNWCCYIWDLKDKTLTIIDPATMSKGELVMSRGHSGTVDKLLKGMFKCIELFFGMKLETDWKTNFLCCDGGTCASYYSGLFTFLFSRAFDGFVLTKEATQFNTGGVFPMVRAKVLYQLITMEGNVGEPPSFLAVGVEDVI